MGHAVVGILQWSNFGHAESQIRQLVWEPEYEPDILLDLNAMSIKKSWTIAPLTNRNYGGFDKQPWYMPKPVSLQMRKILPSIHLAKMRYYFDDHGCLQCEKRDILYGSNGMCENRSVVVRGRLANCLKKWLKHVGVREDFSEALGDCVSSAREIIRRPSGRSAARRASEGDARQYS
jgi:hypothetical protein